MRVHSGCRASQPRAGGAGATGEDCHTSEEAPSLKDAVGSLVFTPGLPRISWRRTYNGADAPGRGTRHLKVCARGSHPQSCRNTQGHRPPKHTPPPEPVSLDPNGTSLRGAGEARTKQGCVQRCCGGSRRHSSWVQVLPPLSRMGGKLTSVSLS